VSPLSIWGRLYLQSDEDGGLDAAATSVVQTIPVGHPPNPIFQNREVRAGVRLKVASESGIA